MKCLLLICFILWDTFLKFRDFSLFQVSMGENFSEEMLVMKDFSNSQMDAFLQFFRDNQLKNVDLKAVLTPVTVHWNSMELYRELKKEHQELR